MKVLKKYSGAIRKLVRLTEEDIKNEFAQIGKEKLEEETSESIKCKKIIELDPSIRFAGICSAKGNLLAAEYKSGVTPLFNNVDLEFSATQSAIRALERNMMGVKLGKMFYSVTAYENVKRATFSLDNGGFLLVSFETRGNEHDIIKKVIYDVGLD